LLTLNATNYSVDTKTLSTQLSQPVVGFSSGSDLLGGQVVRAQISGISTDNNGNITATANNMLPSLFSAFRARSTRLREAPFTVAALPGYINALNTSLSSTPRCLLIHL